MSGPRFSDVVSARCPVHGEYRGSPPFRGLRVCTECGAKLEQVQVLGRSLQPMPWQHHRDVPPFNTAIRAGELRGLVRP